MRKSTGTDELTGLAELGPLGVQTWRDDRVLLLHSRLLVELPAADDADAWARHAFMSSGFGEMPVDGTHGTPRPDGYTLHRAARRRQSRVVGTLLVLTARAVVRLARAALDAYRRRRDARLTYDALRQLDDRLLRDLGLDRSEMTSIAAEIAGTAQYSRIRGTATF